MKKTKTIFASLLALLLAAAVALGLSACGGSEMTDDDAETLSSAVTKTFEYEGSYTFACDIDSVFTIAGQKSTSKSKIKCSLDAENGIEYVSEDDTYSDPDYSSSSSYETYVLVDSEEGKITRYEIDGDGTKSSRSSSGNINYLDALSDLLSDYGLFSLKKLSNIFTVEKLNGVILDFASDLGYSSSSNNANVKTERSGSKYTMSASFESGKLSVSITVKDGLVTKISMYGKEGEDGATVEASSDMEISYSYKSSLASNFSDLSSFETA